MLEEIRARLKSEATDIQIMDVVTEILNYCNINELPSNLYGFTAKKVDKISAYETAGNSRDVKSISEGDTSITFNDSADTIYGLSQAEKTSLKLFRRLRK